MKEGQKVRRVDNQSNEGTIISIYPAGVYTEAKVEWGNGRITWEYIDRLEAIN